MTKKIAFILTLVFLLVLAVPVVFAAVTGDQKAEIDALYQQIVELRKQIIDKYVEGGEISKEQGELLKQRIEQAEQFRRNNNLGPWHCGSLGPGGMMGGCGGSFRGGLTPGSNTNTGATWSYGYGMMGRMMGW